MATKKSAEPEQALVPGAVTPTGDVHRRRTDDDVLTGEWADVVGGPEAGRRVAFQRTVTVGEGGYPDQVVVRSRDDRDELLTVNYSDLRPATTGGR